MHQVNNDSKREVLRELLWIKMRDMDNNKPNLGIALSKSSPASTMIPRLQLRGRCLRMFSSNQA